CGRAGHLLPSRRRHHARHGREVGVQRAPGGHARRHHARVGWSRLAARRPARLATRHRPPFRQLHRRTHARGSRARSGTAHCTHLTRSPGSTVMNPYLSEGEPQPPFRVAVTGLGPITAVGTGVEGFWAGLQRERSGIRTITRFDASPWRSRMAAEVDQFEPETYMDARLA